MEHGSRPAVAGHLGHQVHHGLFVCPFREGLVDFRELPVHFLHHILAPLLLAHGGGDDAHVLLHLADGLRPIDHHHRDAQVFVHAKLISIGVGGGHDEIRPRLGHDFHGKPGQGDGHGNILHVAGDIRNRRVPIRFGDPQQMVRCHHAKEHGIDGRGLAQDALGLPGNRHLCARGVGNHIALAVGLLTHILHPAAGQGDRRRGQQGQLYLQRFLHRSSLCYHPFF